MRHHLERVIDHIVHDHDGRRGGGGRRAHHDHAYHGNPGHLDHARVVHQPPTFRPVFAAHERDGHITTSGRRALPARLFALDPTPDQVRRGIEGRVPFDTLRRARAGLARLSMMRHDGTITERELDEGRRRILARWRSIDRD
jgi:hypothetical protein